MQNEIANTCTEAELDAYLKSHATIPQEELADALTAAAFREELPLVRLLIAYGANPNIEPSVRRPALFNAIEQMNSGITRFLIEHGADVNYSLYNGHTPLHQAVDIEGDAACQARERPRAVITPILIRAGANPNAATVSGVTPMDIAIRYHHKEAIELLREAIERWPRT